MRLLFPAIVCLFALASVVTAHPGEVEHEHDAMAALQKRQFYANARRSLDKCSEQMERSGLKARAEARRKATVAKYSKRHEIRDTDSVLNTSHLSECQYKPSTPDDIVFASNSTCILNPEGETGPFWVKGELIRSDLRDGQPGIPVVIDGQFVNVETCEPIKDLYWDIWNCNSTGVYSGLVAQGNGNADDTSNYNKTFLRGVHQTDHDGVVKYKTIFPGHYSGRTTHIHVIAHMNVTVLPNNTITGGNVAHIGQLFWDQDLIYKVEDTYPYNTNNITITTNAEDRVFSDETESTDSDPVLEYVMLGDKLEHGLFAWITVAVNVSASYDPNYSFVYTSSGGVAESGGSGGAGGGSGPGGNSTGGSNSSSPFPS